MRFVAASNGPVPPPPADAQRSLAQWVIGLKGTLTVLEWETGRESTVTTVTALPKRPFRVIGIDF